MKSLGLFIAFIFLSSTFAAEDGPDMVVEIFRHGIRTPESGQFDNSWDKLGYGELTDAGMRQQYVLGVAMKELYKKLLLPYSPAKIYVQSTQENRTIMSALSQLYGIYYKEGPELGKDYPHELAVPPYNSEEVKKVLDTLKDEDAAIPNRYYPLPVHSLLKKGDTLLQSYLNCPKADEYYFKQKEDETVKKAFADLSQTVENLKQLGITVNNFEDLDHLGDAVIANKANQVKLPGGLSPDSQDFKDIVYWAHWYEIYPSLNMPLQRQLFSGPLLNNILTMFQEKQKKATELDFVFYAAKESLLASLLSAFDIMTPECIKANWEAQKAGKEIPHKECNYPIYASNLIFEFYNTQNPYVMFKYNGNIMKICKGKESCTLDEFAAKIKEVTAGYDLAKFQEFCVIKQEKTEAGKSITGLNSILIGVIIALMIAVTMLYMKNKKANQVSAPKYQNFEVSNL